MRFTINHVKNKLENDGTVRAVRRQCFARPKTLRSLTSRGKVVKRKLQEVREKLAP